MQGKPNPNQSDCTVAMDGRVSAEGEKNMKIKMKKKRRKKKRRRGDIISTPHRRRHASSSAAGARNKSDIFIYLERRRPPRKRRAGGRLAVSSPRNHSPDAKPKQKQKLNFFFQFFNHK